MRAARAGSWAVPVHRGRHHGRAAGPGPGLRAARRCGPWRDEQLRGRHPGQRLGTVERGAVRVLGLATQAVHLVGVAPDGRHWVQQRALDKPNDPGLWDT
jgi:hypothetical protein